MTLGITPETGTQDNIAAGEVKTLAVLVKAAEGAIAIGQVLAFDNVSNAFIKYVSGSAAPAYAVAIEAVTVTAAARVMAIVKGAVTLGELDATAQADPEIEGALLGSGIIPRTGQPA